MNDFEDQLRAALRRPDPPPGLADRVIERTREARRAAVVMRARPHWHAAWNKAWSMGAIAATFALVAVSFTTYQHAREERAARQAETALRIAAEKLNLVRDRALRVKGQQGDN